ncbi:MAG: V-type ATP synthase subunit E [Verrucomicrobiia bacterium]
MTPLDSDGPELLLAEIRKEASRQREEILKRARDAAQKAVQEAEQTAKKTVQDKLMAAHAEGERRTESILATVMVESTRMRAEKTEEVLQSIHDQARERLRQGDGLMERESLVILTAQALPRMAGHNFVLRVSSHDSAALGKGLAQEILRGLGELNVELEIRADPLIAKGRWLLQDEEGRQLWELGHEARLERLWPELRRSVAAEAKLMTHGPPQPGAP